MYVWHFIEKLSKFQLTQWFEGIEDVTYIEIRAGILEG